MALTLNALSISESCIEIKIYLNLIITLLSFPSGIGTGRVKKQHDVIKAGNKEEN